MFSFKKNNEASTSQTSSAETQTSESAAGLSTDPVPADPDALLDQGIKDAEGVDGTNPEPDMSGLDGNPTEEPNSDPAQKVKSRGLIGFSYTAKG